VAVLARTPLFASLDRQALEKVAGLFTEELYHRGEQVCREGDSGDSFYVVLSGDLEVCTRRAGEGEAEAEVRGYLRAGDFFGEMSLLMGGPRAATVTANRRSVLLCLGRRAFDQSFRDNPKVLAYLSQVLCRRLRDAYRGTQTQRPGAVVGVLARPGLKGSSLVAAGVAHLLAEYTGASALLVSLRTIEEETRPGGLRERIAEAPAGDPAALLLEVTAGRSRQHYGERLANAVMELGETFPYVVFDAGEVAEQLALAVGDAADHLIKVIDQVSATPEDDSNVHPVLNLANPGTERVPLDRSKPYVLPVDPTLAELTAREVGARLRRAPRTPVGPPLQRLVRSLLDASVGVALGGGAAFGVAHIGVLRVFEREGIPIDLLAGCSLGSLVALAYAAGVQPDEMAALARRCTREQLLAGMDFTIEKPGLFSGDRIIELFAPMVAATPGFEDLLRPANAVATDLDTGEVVVIGRGRLDAAVRASSSVPMLWSPVRVGGRILVDGGVANPVPVDVVRQMGADIAVAVKVVPPLQRGVETGIQRFFRQVEWLQPSRYFAAGRHLPNTFDTVMNSMQVLQYELGRFTALQADVQVMPDLADFTWSEFYRADELIAHGEAAAEEVVDDLRKRLAQRLHRGPRAASPGAASPGAAGAVPSCDADEPEPSPEPAHA
jgi:NTE family protein